ncbi:MAG: energy-coupling factor transporter transmembrane protein EcfT [Nocardioides sp.]|nr:energy-coupling factor transporter transmembrane protein EcfT [Nocardioides sp.]
MSKTLVKLLLSVVLAVLALLVAAPMALATPDDDIGGGAADVGGGLGIHDVTGPLCSEGPKGAAESQFLPMSRWSGATTEFHSRLSWNDIVDKTTREGVMEMGMSVGNFFYGLSENMVSGGLSFCLLDKAGYTLDSAAAGIGTTLLNSPIIVVLLAAAILAAGARVWRGQGGGGKAFKSLLVKAIILGIFVGMVVGASNSKEAPGGGYSPGTFSPGWFAVTVDTAVTTIANEPVDALYRQASTVTGADSEPDETGGEANIFDCDVMMNAMRSTYREGFTGGSDASSSAMVPMVMSSIWENSGLMTWRIAQYGKDNSLGDRVFCHHLDMQAKPGRTGTYEVLAEIDPAYAAWAASEVNEVSFPGFGTISGTPLVDGQVFNPQSDKARDVAIVAWAACRPGGGSFSAQAKTLQNWEDPGKDSWETDGTLMVRDGLDDSTLSGDIGEAVSGAAGKAGEKAKGAVDSLTFGLASKAVNLAKGSASAIRGALGGDDDEKKAYNPELKDQEQADACNGVFNWLSERYDTGLKASSDPMAMMQSRVEALEKLERGPEDFNWGNEESEILTFANYGGDDGDAADSATDSARDFLLTLHGNQNTSGVVGVLIYVLSSVGMLAVFGLLAAAVIMAKVMAGVFIVACFFVLLGALASNRDFEPVIKFAKAYLGMSLFAWGAIALLAVIGLLASILANLGEAFGGWLSILWSGLSPLMAAFILHHVFKNILNLPSPFKLTAGLAYASTMSKAGGSAAVNGLDRITSGGAGIVKRTAASAMGTRLGTPKNSAGQGTGKGTGTYGKMTPPKPKDTTSSQQQAPTKGAGPSDGGGGSTGKRSNPTAAQAAATRSELQRKASDPGVSAGERTKARKQLKAEDRKHRRKAMERVKEARKESSLPQRAREHGGRISGAGSKAAVLGGVGALAAGPAGAVVMGGGYLGARAGAAGIRKVTHASKNAVAGVTGAGHAQMMDRAKPEVDAWFAANEEAQNQQGRGKDK